MTTEATRGLDAQSAAPATRRRPTDSKPAPGIPLPGPVLFPPRPAGR